jgi:hypothetical protein
LLRLVNRKMQRRIDGAKKPTKISKAELSQILDPTI